VSDPVAIYAAVVATGSAAWQGYAWWRDRTVKASVTVAAGNPVDAGGATLVFITLENRSAFPVRWTQAGLDLQDGSDQFALVGLGEHVAEGFPPLPAVVESHDSHTTAIEAEKVLAWGFDLTQPMTAQARVGSGQVFKSEPRTLLVR
jgi:hypothetical protein